MQTQVGKAKTLKKSPRYTRNAKCFVTHNRRDHFRSEDELRSFMTAGLDVWWSGWNVLHAALRCANLWNLALVCQWSYDLRSVLFVVVFSCWLLVISERSALVGRRFRNTRAIGMTFWPMMGPTLDEGAVAAVNLPPDRTRYFCLCF